jgi:tRNA-2-methylthio-N6-dimethylallyladenosine synthase
MATQTIPLAEIAPERPAGPLVSSLRTFHVWTVGCQMNKADSEKFAAGLVRLGMRSVDEPEDADLVVVNTCSVRQGAEDRAYSKLGALKKLRDRHNADLKIAVMGCMVGPKHEGLKKRFPYVDVFARPQAFEDIIRAVMPEDDLGGEFWPETVSQPEGVTAFVPVVHGCDKFCTYCIVPYRRGRERSRELWDVRHEVAVLASRGVKEVTLLGQTVEAYGHDLPEPADLADLFEMIHEVPGIERIRFLTSYPKDMTDRIIQSVATLPKVCEFYNIPVQSGDNEVLAAMRRGYTVEEYVERVQKIRELAPGAALHTDIIVGFPGETEAQFQSTYDLLEDLRFDKVHVAAYSPRPGTIAFRKMEDNVPHDEKMRRLHAVEELQERVGCEINECLVGTAQEVLIEEQHEGRWTGRSRGNKLVHFTGDCAIGEMVNVEITDVSAWSLKGQLQPQPF